MARKRGQESPRLLETNRLQIELRALDLQLMDELLTVNVAELAAAGAISLERVPQDGMRVRAAAGAASFRRSATAPRPRPERAPPILTRAS